MSTVRRPATTGRCSRPSTREGSATTTSRSSSTRRSSSAASPTDDSSSIRGSATRYGTSQRDMLRRFPSRPSSRTPSMPSKRRCWAKPTWCASSGGSTSSRRGSARSRSSLSRACTARSPARRGASSGVRGRRRAEAAREPRPSDASRRRASDPVGLSPEPTRPRLGGLRVAVVLKWPGLGGAERQALVLARHLREVEGASVEVQALTDAVGRAVAAFRDAGIPWQGRRGRWRGSAPWTVARLARAAASLRRARPDVLLPYCDVPNVVCSLVWRYVGARTCVWSQRDTLPFTLGESFVRRALETTPVIVSNSEHGADFLAAHGAARERIRVIANGVDLAPARETRLEWRRRLGATKGTVVVTAVAHFYPRKGHETLLEAWRNVLERADGSRDRLTLVLAGRPEGRRELLE